MAALRLFQLPKSAQYKVLANLAVIEIVNLSFCSKKSKTFVKNVGLKATRLTVCLENDLSVEIATKSSRLSLTFMARLTRTDSPLDDPRNIDFKPSLSFIQLVRHYSYIFNMNEITKCSIAFTRNRYGIESIKRCLEGFTVRTLVVGRYCPETNFQPVLALGILPKVLILYRNAFRDATFIRKVLASNYDSIEIFDYFPVYFSKLHNLLAINSAVIKIRGTRVSDKKLNQFLKIWMKTSMPRLRKLQFYFTDNRVIDEKVVLKGIAYTVNPPERERMMRVEMENRLRRDFVIGGLEITRIDRIKATIILERSTFKFYVWNE